MIEPNSQAAQDLAKYAREEGQKLADANVRAVMNRAALNMAKASLRALVEVIESGERPVSPDSAEAAAWQERKKQAISDARKILET